MFPMDVMADLGIDKADCEKREQQGAGGKSYYWAWKGGTLPADFFGITVDLHVNFCNTPFILLGRADFFKTFKASFDQRGMKFILESY